MSTDPLNLVLYSNIGAMAGYVVTGLFATSTIHQFIFVGPETPLSRGLLHAVATVVSGVLVGQALAAASQDRNVKKQAVRTFAAVQAISVWSTILNRRIFDPVQGKILTGILCASAATNIYFGWLAN
jgi:hypothetical protein